MSTVLSDAALSVWAKTDPDDRDAWLPLCRHLEDAAAVAGLLWDHWLPRAVKDQVSGPLAGGHDDGRILVTWLAGVHDVGKATPAFAVQVDQTHHHLTSRMRHHGLAMPSALTERSRLRHEVAGHHALSRWLVAQGWARRSADAFAVAVGGHHGSPPSEMALHEVPARPHLLGDGVWTAVQDELLTVMTTLTGAAGRLDDWSRCPLPQTAQVLAGAVVMMADWIASDSDLFGLYPDTADQGLDERVAQAWERLSLPPSWEPLAPTDDDARLFADRFTLPPGASPLPVQRAAVEVARQAERPALVVIEAPMGSGKTEAALAAAEVLAHRFGAGGVFVALPSMATSDAMFTRVLRWVERLPAADGQDLSVFLAHGKAALNPEAQLPCARGPRAVAQDEEPADRGRRSTTAVATAHSWLHGRKRGPLSSIVVGTIDQVLFAALQSRHLALRHLALAGKVVIVDEVHAVDVYMGSYLQQVLHWLGAYGVPVVLLSATLPSAQRAALVAAYEDGRSANVPRLPGALGVEPVVGAALPVGYPAITTSTGGEPQVRVVPAGVPERQVAVETLADDDEALVAVLREAMVDGGCVAVVRNTVGRAQRTYELLARELGGDVVLLHSRFVASDRAARERDLRERLGPPSVVRAAGRERPRSLVVVGTQVIEQSLDVDVDLMVTDLAPVDLVLQRIGRLHRHRRGPGQGERPQRLRRARCLIAGVEDWSAGSPEPVEGSKAVYHHALLLRALAVLAPVAERGHLVLPRDIAPLVEAAYDEGWAPPPGWEDVAAEAEHKRAEREAAQSHRARTYRLGDVKRPGRPLLDWLTLSVGDADDSVRGQAQVRDSDESVEVVVVQRVDGEVRLLEWIEPHGGRVLDVMSPPHDALARVAAGCTLRLPVQLSNPARIDAVIRTLEDECFDGWQRSRWLSGQLVLVLDADLSTTLGGHTVTYDRERGLLTERQEDR